MHPFEYTQGATAEAAMQAVHSGEHAFFFAGGTTLIDLMKLDVMTPDRLVDINALAFSTIEARNDSVKIGANVRNSDLAHNKTVREKMPVLSEALLAGASAQLRNMASTAGNIMQRTRCEYFRDVNSKCNKRSPGSGCDALTGFNRHHALLGGSESCIAVHASDMCVALAALDTTIHTLKRDGAGRTIPFGDFHTLPGNTPERETVLEHGELITHVEIKHSAAAKHSHYLKVRDRSSYEFALTSAAVALELDGKKIVEARVALGGVATKPWRSKEAEDALRGKEVSESVFQAAAEEALKNAEPREHNAFKVDLAKRTIVYALNELMERSR